AVLDLTSVPLDSGTDLPDLLSPRLDLSQLSDLAGFDADLANPSDLADANLTFDLSLPSTDLAQFCQTVTVSTLAGDGTDAFLDGPGSLAHFQFPTGIAVDGLGTLYVADSGGHRIRKLTPDGTTSTLAGNGVATFADGTGGPSGTASFNSPADVAL